MREKILIIEDELIIAEDMAAILRAQNYTVSGIACSYDEALACLDAAMPSLVLLDIRLAGSAPGTEIARVLHQRYQLPFVYVTSFSDKQTLAEVKDTQPTGFLLKPFTEQSLLTAVDLALHQATLGKQHRPTDPDPPLLFKDGPTHISLPLRELLLIKSEGNYVRLVAQNQQFLLRQPLHQLASQLPAHRFAQCHRQYIVNLEHLSKIEGNSAWVGRHEVPLSKEQRAPLLARMAERSRTLHRQ